MTRRSTSKSVSMAKERWLMPPQCTMTSTWPCHANASATLAGRDDAFARSSGRTKERCCSFSVQPFLTFSRPSLLLEDRMTRAPFCTHRVAAASPMPLLAPVIQTMGLDNSDVNVRVFGVLFDKGASWWDFISHEHREDVVAGRSVFDGDLTQSAVFWIEGGIP